MPAICRLQRTDGLTKSTRASRPGNNQYSDLPAAAGRLGVELISLSLDLECYEPNQSEHQEALSRIDDIRRQIRQAHANMKSHRQAGRKGKGNSDTSEDRTRSFSGFQENPRVQKRCPHTTPAKHQSAQDDLTTSLQGNNIHNQKAGWISRGTVNRKR